MTLLFSESLVYILVIGALIGTAIAAGALIIMFIHDVRNDQVW